MARRISETEMDMIERPQIECRDVRKVFGSYVDGELTETLCGRIDDHIQSCHSCQEFDESYREVISLAREIGEEENQKPMPEAVRRRLRESLNERLGINLSID